MVIVIEVPGAPVSKNHGRRIDPRRPSMPMFRPVEATEWMRRIRNEAQRVARDAKWPEPFSVAEVAIDFSKFNSKHDSGAGNEYVFDALQVPTVKDMARFKSSWGLYSNDRDAWCRSSPMPVHDGGERRCVFTAELLRVREKEEADRLRGLWLATIRRAHVKSHPPPS